MRGQRKGEGRVKMLHVGTYSDCVLMVGAGDDTACKPHHCCILAASICCPHTTGGCVSSLAVNICSCA
eukprot:1145909-Pelagomonas_calceolata.AAC.8